MSQVLNQGGGFILALVDEDEEEEDRSSTALAPYSGGFLSSGFGPKDDT